MKFIIYTDGGARDNPGPAGAGVVIKSNGQITKTIAKYLGVATNNQAEYQALIFGLEAAKKLGATEADCYSDSQLLVEQVNHRWKIKNHGLGPLFIKVWNLSQGFKKINFYYIPREKNQEADALVNKAIDKHIK